MRDELDLATGTVYSRCWYGDVPCRSKRTYEDMHVCTVVGDVYRKVPVVVAIAVTVDAEVIPRMHMPRYPYCHGLDG